MHIIVMICLCLLYAIITGGVYRYLSIKESDEYNDDMENVLISMFWIVYVVTIPFIGAGYLGCKLIDKLYESKNKKNR